MAIARRLARDTACNFLTVFATSGLGLAVTALAARGLQPDRMGIFTLLTWAGGMLGMLANLGSVTATLKAMAEALGRGDEQEAAGVLAVMARQVMVTSLAVTAVGALGAPSLAVALHRPDLTAAGFACALGALPAALVALLTAAAQARRRYDQVAVLTALGAGATLALTLVGLAMGGSLAILVAAPALGNALAALAYLGLFEAWHPRWWQERLPLEQVRGLRSYQGPVFVMLVLDSVVWQRSEVFFLGAYSPAREVAYYGMAFALATMAMKLLPGTLIGLLLPNMSRAVGAGDPDTVARIFRTSCRGMALLAMPVAVGGSLLAPALVHVLYGPGYEPVAGLLAALLASNALVMVFGFPASSVLYATDAQHRLVRIGLVVSALNLALAWWWIPRWGAWGAVVACGLAQASSLLPGLTEARKRLGVGSPKGAIAHLTLCALGMAIPVALLARMLPSGLALALAPPVGAVVYAALVWLTGALEPEEKAMLLNSLARRPAPEAT